MPVVNYHTVDGVLFGETDASGIRRDYLIDGVDSVIATVDQTPSIRNEYRYSPYGRFTAQLGPDVEPKFLWTGATGSRRSGAGHATNYNRARTYAGETGRWTSVDPLWNDESAYGYVEGNPVNRVDPEGLQKKRVPSYDPHNPYPWFRKPFPWWWTTQPPHRLKPKGISHPFPDGWNYGSYCGQSNIQNPSRQVLPQDALDACCQKHDRCLEANYGAGNSASVGHRCCDTSLISCAIGIMSSGGCKKSPLPGPCEEATWQLTLGMIVARYKGFPGPELTGGKPCVPEKNWPQYIYEHWGSPRFGKPCGTGSKVEEDAK